ncbi:MAG: hypothetical protein DHS20C08_06060 [Rhodomicrobium sp.]|nr:MAG: hypothetical protein DHS20C08_06060 [Rhodomicrobium sp.]
MVSANKTPNMSAKKEKSRHEVKIATNASFFYIFLWMLAAIGAITYIALLANHTLPDYLKASQLKVANLPGLAALEADKTSSRKKFTELQTTLSVTKDNIRQMNVKYYALENRINNISNRLSLMQSNIKPQNTPLTSGLDDPELNTGAINTIDSSNKIPDAKKLEIPLRKDAISKSLEQHKKEQTAKKASDKTSLAEQKLAANRLELTKKPVVKDILNNKDQPKKNANPTIMRTMFAVSLGHYPDLKNLKNAWKQLNKKHSTALGTLKPRYITLVIDNKPVYQLVSGPLDQAIDAAKICNYLQQMKTYCRQTVFHGSDL